MWWIWSWIWQLLWQAPSPLWQGPKVRDSWRWPVPPATNTVGQWSSVMAPPTTNVISSPLSNPLGGSSEELSSRRWVWMWLEGSQLHTLPTYQTELSTIVVVPVQVTRHVPMHMQQLDTQEVLLECLPDLNLRLWWTLSIGWGFCATLGVRSWMQRV